MIGGGREIRRLRAALQAWAKVALPEFAPLRIASLTRPAAGLSSETWLIAAIAGQDRSPVNWVLRIEPTHRQIYENPAVERQFGMIETLRRKSALPVPAAIRFEADPSVLGAPFFLMERAPGIAPPNDYHCTGLFAEIAPAEREALWLESIAALTALHRLNPADFGFLAFAAAGIDADGIVQELARWDSYRTFIGLSSIPLFDRARRLIEDHRPAAGPVGVAWGDARPCNILFDQGHCAALLDWETASLGGAETDLGWWIFYDRMICEGAGVSRLSGLGDGAATIAAWEHFAGRKAVAIEWHVLFAAYRFALICERAITLSMTPRGVPPGAARPSHPAAVELERIAATFVG